MEFFLAVSALALGIIIMLATTLPFAAALALMIGGGAYFLANLIATTLRCFCCPIESEHDLQSVDKTSQHSPSFDSNEEFLQKEQSQKLDKLAQKQKRAEREYKEQHRRNLASYEAKKQAEVERHEKAVAQLQLNRESDDSKSSSAPPPVSQKTSIKAKKSENLGADYKKEKRQRETDTTAAEREIWSDYHEKRKAANKQYNATTQSKIDALKIEKEKLEKELIEARRLVPESPKEFKDLENLLESQAKINQLEIAIQSLDGQLRIYRSALV